MASSSDAVRNFVYDFHRSSLRQGWQIVQQLEANRLDSWESINARFNVKSLNDEDWDDTDEDKITAFCQACPLLERKLTMQLAAQAALFVHTKTPQPLKRGNSARMGSLRDRIDRLYLQERAPSNFSRVFSMGLGRSFHQAGPVPKSSKLVPFMEAVQHPGFSTTAT